MAEPKIVAECYYAFHRHWRAELGKPVKPVPLTAQAARVHSAAGHDVRPVEGEGRKP